MGFRGSAPAGAQVIEARRVLIVEDEPLTRGLVAGFLEAAGFLTAEAETAQRAIKQLREWDPDALIVDLSLGDGPGGGEVLAAAERIAPWVAVIVLTNSPTPALAGVASDLIPARAAYLHKRSVLGGDLLLRALESALADEPPRRDDSKADDPLTRLSADQLEVLSLVAQGLSNAEIAVRRGTSPHAVEQVFQRVTRALGIPRDASVNPRVAAARIFYARGRAAT